MSRSIDQLLKRGRENLPDNVGPVFDTALGLGSLVSSGIEGYKSARQEFGQIKRFLKRFTHLSNDPQALFYLINRVMREDPVRLPEYGLDKNSIDILRRLLSGDADVLAEGGIVGDGPYVNRPTLYNEGVVKMRRNEFGGLVKGDPVGFPESSMKNIRLPKDNNYKDRLSTFKRNPYEDKSNITSESEFNELGNIGERNKFKYMIHSNPYSQNEVKILKSPEEVMDYLNSDLKTSFGYKRWSGFEFGSDHIWDIQMRPYISKDGTTLVPEFPKYRLPQIGVGSDGKNDILEIVEFDFGLNCPCISYELRFGDLSTDNLNLYNDSSLNYITGFRYDMTLSLTIVDDIYRSMHKYFSKYINNIYDIHSNSMAVYSQAAFEITLMIFRAGYQLNYITKLICVPTNLDISFSGKDQPDEEEVSMDFSVIGMVRPESGNITLPEADAMSEGEWKKTKWNEIISSPLSYEK
jgi:hypothetical protein